MHLVVDRITMNFGGLLALDDISLDFGDSGIRGIIGPNGSGKSTLFNVITGFVKPTSGKVWLDGRDVTALPPHRMNTIGVGRTFQAANVFRSLTVLENVLVGSHPRFRHTGVFPALWRLPSTRREENRFRDEARELLRFVGLSCLESTMAGSLSYGQQKLLEIARALGGQPKILLLDEPAAGLNATEIEDLRVLLDRIHSRGAGIVLIEHHMKLIMSVSQIVTCLDHGKVIAEGGPSSVSSDPLVLEAYLGARRE